MTNIHLAETFLSPQGEGMYMGTLMYFIRTAGCSVGKPIPGGSPAYIERCTLYDGRNFLCDTNFRKSETLDTAEVVKRIPAVNHICITGGEPLNQCVAMKEIIDNVLANTRITVHIETSGTIDAPWLYNMQYRDRVWVTVSPKAGVLPDMLDRADEIKLLVDDNFDPVRAGRLVYGLRAQIFLSPISDEHTLIQKNIKHCLQLLGVNPNWRMTLQMHKVIGVR